MKFYGILLVVAIIVLGVGLYLKLSDLGEYSYYSASGRLELNTEQWEDFKSEIYKQPEVRFNQINYLNSGELKLVSFDNIHVSENFPYGEISIKHDKGEILKQISLSLILIGAFLTTGTLTIIANDYCF